ncbi:shikimate kinase AroK [Virgibacillus siamensis]|uniref:Shikimate kinase n=2 Tax=Virgibacillus siamensis TaxID=480071 RepID=A0ABP3R8A3_9BACI
MTIYLIGFMGSGKSTVGKVLGGRIRGGHADTDVFIDAQYGTISEIFRIHGENTFRKYESAALENLSAEHEIVSTGGGIVERQKNISLMKANGVIVYLQTAFTEIQSRLMHDTERPLWNTDMEKKEKLFRRRSQLYQGCADIAIQTDQKTPDDIAGEIQEAVEKFLAANKG